MFKFKNSFFLFIILALTSDAFANLVSQLNSEALFHSVPEKYKGQPFIHINPRLIQQDRFSCGYRAIFHIQAFENARTAEGSFEVNLNNALKDAEALEKIFQFDRNLNGLLPAATISIIKNLNLQNQFLFVFFKDFFRINHFDEQGSGFCYDDITYCQLEWAYQTKELFKQLNGPKKAIYFYTIFDKLISHENGNNEPHVALFIIFTDANNNANLYLIDTSNKTLIRYANHPYGIILNDAIDKLLLLVNDYNQQKIQKAKIIQNQKTRPTQSISNKNINQGKFQKRKK